MFYDSDKSENSILREVCLNSVRQVETILDQYDPEIADMFSRASHILKEEMCVAKDTRILDELFSSNFHSRLDSDTNFIPSNGDAPCLPRLVAWANGRWNNQDRNGFPKIFKQIDKFWADCQRINMTSLIFTAAWDLGAFHNDYVNSFRQYAGEGKSVAVILYSYTGFSVQYLG